MDSSRQTVIEHWMRLLLHNNHIYAPPIIVIILAFAENIYDTLNLSKSTECLQLLEKLGDNTPTKERIILSEKIIKINKRGKSQNRIILITNKALYNLKPKRIQNNPKRIDLEQIVSITVCSSSNEFAIHIPEQYDLRYKSHIKNVITSTIAEKYKYKTKKELTINILDILTTIDTFKHQVLSSRQQRFDVNQQLMSKMSEHKFDDEIKYGKSAPITGYLFESDQKVTFDDFELLKVIRYRHYNCKVLKVRKKDNNNIYALQILTKKALIAKYQISHTSADRTLLRKHQHPFLFPLRYGFQTEEKLYFVMEYAEMENLFVCLKRKIRFSEIEAQFIVAQIVLLFEHLHNINVIYKDLKPENIFINKNGYIYMWNYYVTISVESHYDLIGTPEYMSPELIQKIDYNKSVDWWSLGVILYELIFGVVPFEGINIHEIYQKIIGSEEIIFHGCVSNECKDMIISLLDRDPSKRLGTGWNGVKCIKKHAFFKNIDWDKLYKKQLDPLYKPVI